MSRLRRIRIGDLHASAAEIGNLRRILSDGGVAAIPTETFYGLAADPGNAAGIRRIFEAKGRHESKPLPVVFCSRAQLRDLGVEAADALLRRYFSLWPAPLTVVLAIRDPIPASLGRRTLGVRIPASPELVRLLEETGPLTATSANPAGGPPLSDPDEVAAAFEGKIDLVIDGGRTSGGKPSTLIDATVDPPAVLRPGAFPWP